MENALDAEPMDMGFIERQLIKEALVIAERREAWMLSREVLQPIVNAMRKIGATVGLSDNLDVRLTGDAAALAKAVRILRTSGFEFSSSRPKKGDTTWCTFFKCQGCSVDVWFNFSSSVCRIVQVGTRTVQQPVYETVCDNIELPPADELAAKIIELTSPPAIVDEIPF